MRYLKTICLCLLLAGLLSCQSEQEQADQTIDQLEQQTATELTPEQGEQLLGAYEDYVATYDDDPDKNAGYLLRAAKLLQRLERYPGAANRLLAAIRQYPEAPTTPEATVLLGDLYLNRLNKLEQGLSAYQITAQAFPSSDAAKAASSKLPAGLPDLAQRLNDMNLSIYNDSLGQIDYRIANSYIASGELYYTLQPDAEDAPDVLFGTAEAARTIRSSEKALELYTRFGENHPQHEQAAQALFLRAFTLDSELQRPEDARVLYQAFIDQYPDHPFAKDAKVMLEHLGKDDAAIIESITRGNEELELEKTANEKSKGEAVTPKRQITE